MMRVNFEKRSEPNGMFSVVITFSDVPTNEQAEAAMNLVKRALLKQGAVGFTSDPLK